MKKPLISPMAFTSVLLLVLASCGAEADNSAKYQDYSFGPTGVGRQNTYAAYRERYTGAALADRDVPLDLFAYSDAASATELLFFADTERVLRVEEEGFVEYPITLERGGLYNLYVEYYPVESRGISIERGLRVNGGSPFLGAERLVFSRVWADAGPVRIDNRGNQIRPSQREAPRWEGSRAQDAMGYVTEPYLFYFPPGESVIRLEGVTEPWVIRKIVLAAPVAGRTYREYIQTFNPGGFQNRDVGFSLKIQGEDAKFRSDPSLYAVFDRSSGQTEPASAARIVLNIAGGVSWKTPGQWIEWEFEVPEDGMYRISIKARQNHNRGFVSSRSILIDGAIPCAELAAVPFRYGNGWRLTTFQDGAGEDLLLPLSRGTHSIRLQVTLGELGGLLETMEETVFRLNAIYRKILVLTGPSPDPYRDYRLDVVYPDAIRDMEGESKVLYKLVDDLTAYAGGERSPQAAQALTLARQLELFVDRPDKIPGAIGNFKSNISGMADNILALSNCPLDIDYILVSAPGVKPPKVRDNFFIALGHELASFAASFFTDYTTLGDSSQSAGAVQAWILTGRDQSSILKAMIDDQFTPFSGIPVNVKLVDVVALMPAVVAGTGPDIALSVSGGDPVNYAIRKAAQDLSSFPGFNEVIKSFNPSALTAFRYDGGVYALPETQTFQVMFYRKDILEDLGLSVPQTWAELIAMLPVIQKNNMNVGIPSVAGVDATGGGSNTSGFLTQLYQRGGALYNVAGSRTVLDGETAIHAFDAYTQFYTHYQIPKSFDFVNRFRTGEMPIGFSEFTSFNNLEVFAPEIRGLWGFALLPGTPRMDGSLDRSAPSGGVAAMVLSRSPRKDAAWEFLTWWISEETQLRFGRELESVMGAAARYATANVAAFNRTAWRSGDLAVLREQRFWTVGTPEVPGSYYVSRHIANASRKVLNDSADTRETLLRYNRTINDELMKKRKEFGLE